jgi:hypothetical protein
MRHVDPLGCWYPAPVEQFFLRRCRSDVASLDWMPADDANQPQEPTMQYLLLIYAAEADRAKFMKDQAAMTAMLGEYRTFTQSIIQSGNFKAGDALQPVATATTVRVKDGKTLTTDGPFAETREQLGGYYLIEAKDLDAALAIAARVPGAKYGSIEVRPLMVFD